MPDTTPVRSPDAAKNGDSLNVSSKSFSDGGAIPMEHVFTHCGGKNASPQLSWSGAPQGTRSYAITCFDPDAPTGSGYWHWVAFNIPGSVTSLEAGAGNSDSPAGGKGGYSDFGMHSYGGPCPPPGHGKHHYTFTVYALDVDKVEGASENTTGATLVFSMRGHVLATGRITGLFGH
jgi:Raf kinase inhibitor-like YbhB/YbcL family protein